MSRASRCLQSSDDVRDALVLEPLFQPGQSLAWAGTRLTKSSRIHCVGPVHIFFRKYGGQSCSLRSYYPMEPNMAGESSDWSELRRRIERGDAAALIELFARHRDRLKRMVKLRLDRRLQGRIDASDVLAGGVHRRRSASAAEYLASPSMPVFLWLRWITGQRLVTLHRKHLGQQGARRRAGGFAPSWRAAPGHLGLAGGHAPGPADLAHACRATSRAPAQGAGCLQCHGADRSRDPHAAPLRRAEQQRDGRRCWGSARRRQATATSARSSGSRTASPGIPGFLDSLNPSASRSLARRTRHA